MIFRVRLLATIRYRWLKVQEKAASRLQSGNPTETTPHLQTGLQGEQAVMFHLGRVGYTVVARRWTSTRLRGDLDLIAWFGNCLCFIEVKTRTARGFRPAESAVDDQKRNTMRALARDYLRIFPENQRKTIPIRFDVVSVYFESDHPEFEFFQNAFGWD